MVQRLKIYIFTGVLTIGMVFPGVRSTCQSAGTAAISRLDSLDKRIDYLQHQIPRLKQARDVSYYNIQRELDLTIFMRTYEEYVIEEELFKAKEFVESRLDRAEFRRDQYSIDFYNKYKDLVYKQIKLQRMHYQELFAKDKNFKNEYDRYIQPADAEAYHKARRMVELSLRYARENNLAEAAKMLESYLAYTDALIFDLNRPEYDLKELTAQARSFEKVFLPLVESDSLKDIKEAESLVDYCLNYTSLTHANLSRDYFLKQKLVIGAALSDLLEKEGREKELAKYTDQAVNARIDTLNPCGVFKWRNHIIVIDEFLPSSAFESVKKGEAILHADKMLSAYLHKNQLCRSVEDLKFGYTFVIPYRSDAKNSSFYFNRQTQKWQYMACYTVVDNPDYTLEISKFMPPLYFENENEMVNAQ
jgi:hypothetical protein